MGEQAGMVGEPPIVGSRLGSFELIAPAGRWGGQARFEGRAAADGAHAGVTALVIAAPIAGETPARINASVARLRVIAALRHDALLPVAETGAWEGGLYVAHVLPGDLTLAARLEREGPIRPAEVAVSISRLAAALDTAHAGGVPHGDVRADNVWIGGDGRPLLGGFVLAASDDLTAAADAAGLATLAAAMLTGRHGAAAVAGDPVPALWDGPWGLPAVVRESVQRGLDPDPARRYLSAGAFAAAFASAIDAVVASQIAGVWEAMERRDFAMAEMLCEAAIGLRPGDGELALLQLHVRTNAGNGPSSLVYPMADAADAGQLPTLLPPTGGGSADPSVSSARSAATLPGEIESLPPELATLLAMPSRQEHSPANAWIALVTGMAVLLALMFFAALLAMSYRGP